MGSTSNFHIPTRAPKPLPPAAPKAKGKPGSHELFKEVAWIIFDYKNHCDPEDWTVEAIAGIIQKWSDEEL